NLSKCTSRATSINYYKCLNLFPFIFQQRVEPTLNDGFLTFTARLAGNDMGRFTKDYLAAFVHCSLRSITNPGVSGDIAA
ncbi:MAG: hypothetical protein QMA98_04150, partial [Pseudomonadales bacterium]